jgi:5-methylcytosine-specific restriction enzyme subunit McrC
MLMNVCYFIIDGLLMTTEKGTYKMRSFSEEHMSRLFEKFVLEFYKKKHPNLNAKAARISWNINTEESTISILPKMQTDVMLSSGVRTLIIDTKYYSKSMQIQYDKKTIHSSNLYQIQSYVMNHDVYHTGKVDGMLLYAKTEEDVIPEGQISLKDGNVIYFRTLDLNQDFSKIEEKLDEFVTDWIKH